MAKSIVILTPDMGSQQVIEGRDGPRQGIRRVVFSHFAC